MKNKIFCTALFILLINVIFATNNKIEKQTFIFSVKGADTLRLDKYDNQSILEEKPCVVFLFGGGFANGVRDNPDYNIYFTQLVNDGYVVVSIDYRLGLKNIQNNEDLNPEKVITSLNNAVSIAVEDLYDATKYIVDRAKDWNINKNEIVASGSSAGAITVLQGEYGISNQIELTEKLPDNFNFAGVIAFAGAILGTNNDLTWKRKPAPIQMFHGDADRNVPYAKLTYGSIGLYGSKYISEQMKALKFPYYFYDVENGAHEISSTPMHQNLEEIKIFMDRFVIAKQSLIINTQVTSTDKMEVKKDFEIMDYLRTNFGK